MLSGKGGGGTRGNDLALKLQYLSYYLWKQKVFTLRTALPCRSILREEYCSFSAKAVIDTNLFLNVTKIIPKKYKQNCFSKQS